MRRSEIESLVADVDLLENVTPQDLAKEAKLGWVKRLLFLAVWPLIKPFLARKLGQNVTDLLGRVLEGL